MNFEQIRQIPHYYYDADSFLQIVKIIGIDFNINEEQIKIDTEYLNQAYDNFFKKIIILGSDEDKVKLLFSFRYFMNDGSRGYFGEPDKDIVNIISSINDKKLIIELAGYLDDNSQVNGLSYAFATAYDNESKEMKEGSIEKEFAEGGEILNEKKQLIDERKKQSERDEKDKQIYVELDNYRMKGYRENPPYVVAEKICELSRDEYKINAMRQYYIENAERIRGTDNHLLDLVMYNELYSIAIVVKSMDKDETKRYLIEEYLEKTFKYFQELFSSLGIEMTEGNIKNYEHYKFVCIESLEDKTAEISELKARGKYEAYFEYLKSAYRTDMNTRGITVSGIHKNGLKLQTDKEKEKYLKSGDAYKRAITFDEGNIDLYLGIINIFKDIIISMDSDENKIRLYYETIEPLRDYYIECLNKNQQTEEIELFNNGMKMTFISIVDSFKDKSYMIDTLIKYEKLEEYLQYSFTSENKNQIIQDNIEKILKYFGKNDIEEKKAMLERMSQSNSRVYELMDYRLLDDKFTNIFSENEINLIINLPRYLIDRCCEFDDKNLKFIACITKNIDDEDDFGSYFQYILASISSYNELIANIDYDSLTEEQKDRFKVIIQYKNIFDIKSLEDIENFDKIKDLKLQEIMDSQKGNDLDEDRIIEKKNILLLKLLGIDYETALEFTIEFKELESEDIELQLIRRIVLLDGFGLEKGETNKILDRLLNDERVKGKQVQLVDKLKARKVYTKKYEKKYNEVLYKPEDGTFIEEKDGIKFYNMGTSFSILSTSVSAYADRYRWKYSEVDLKEMWNRKDLASNHFCGSFSTDEMIGIIKTKNGVYYGFSNMRPESLLFMSDCDCQSYSSTLQSYCNGIRQFRFPDSMIEHTGTDLLRKDLYNEIDVKRRIANTIIEPDYIIAIKFHGKIVNEEAAIKAAKDWEGKKQVHVLDVDRCIEKCRENLDKAVMEYKANPSDDNLRKVWSIFHKASITYGMFYTSTFGISYVNQKKYPPFIDIVDLPEDLKKNIDYYEFDAFYSLKYKLKEKLVPEIQITQKEVISDIDKLMDKMYGPRKNNLETTMPLEDNSKTEESSEKQPNLTQNRLTFDEVGKGTVKTFLEDPKKEMSFSEKIKAAIRNFIDKMFNGR